MYRLINDNISLLLSGINKKEHIDPYISITRSFKEGKNNSVDFKITYRKFYQLNVARLSDEFCESYFSLLERNRNTREIDIETITNELYELESNKQGTHAVHFSFASKLVHTLDNSLPVYDSMVAAFYFFPAIKFNWRKERKIKEYLKSYQFLKKEYHRIIEGNLLKQSINKFREKFSVVNDYTDVKIIDTLLWRYSALLKSGAVRGGEIKYG
jgi:hypothetical protein